MKGKLNHWLQALLSRPEVLVLFAVLVVADLIIVNFGKMLSPIFASIVIAYLLQWPINKLERYVSHSLAVVLVYSLFLGLLIFAFFGLLPLLWRQLSNLFASLPTMLTHGQAILMDLPQRYPRYISAKEIEALINGIKTQSVTYSQEILSATLASLTSLVVLSVYLILVPLLVYFFLMDKKPLLIYLKRYLPKRRQLLAKVWLEVYEQIGHYVRGKVLEVLIVGIAFYLQFIIMGLNYATLLAVLVGLSVIIPYIGAVIVTIPIFIIAFLQWGLGSYLAYFVVIYTILIAVDANLLVPLLFAEAVDLHPVAIILAVLFFGGVFGFWGVFFAIPLASLVKAVLRVLYEKPVNRLG